MEINDDTKYSGALTEEVFDKWLRTDPLAAIFFCPGAEGTMSRAEVWEKDRVLGGHYDRMYNLRHKDDEASNDD